LLRRIKLKNATAFRVGFDKRDITEILAAWSEILSSERWTEGNRVTEFELAMGALQGMGTVAMSSWSGAALACLSYYGLAGQRVLCPTNTFMATPLAVKHVGGEVVFGDCNRDDLCLSSDAVRRGIAKGIKAVVIVHIGGHIAFEIEDIARQCRDNGVILIEDCAHAIGASWNGKLAGTWGDAALFSLYATKTITTGEGGILCTRDEALIEYGKSYRNYGKPDFSVSGLNFRMDEFRATLGSYQLRRLHEIIEWKNSYARMNLDPIYERRLQLPEGMISNYYKYIVFQPLEHSTGRVYSELCHPHFGISEAFPNAEWIARNHSCVPIYYEPNRTA
jgi:perosamine synthetase